jgi:alkanesulfonate monooxygenase SsuD/methylene tetrahydromethanopterin reductase-like flavin-dependent oxidoreductase (luciferase family)
VKARAAWLGRRPEDIKILPSASFVLGDTEAEAVELHHEVRNQQINGKTALILLEQVWNRDLSGYDPEGQLPDIDPDPEAEPIIQGRALLHQDRFATVARWRAIAEEKKLTLRELVIDQFERGPFVGTPAGSNEPRHRDPAPRSGTEIRHNACRQLLPAAAAGTLQVVVARTYPLTEPASPLRLVADGHAGGKVVLLP